MKRLIVFLVVALFAVVAVTAQTSFTPIRKNVHTISVPLGLVTPDSLLTLNQVDSILNVFDISAKDKLQLYSIYITMTIGDNNDADTYMVSTLQKSPNATVWFGIDTVNYLMTVDSTWVFEDITTSVAANYLRVHNEMTSVGDTCTLTRIDLQFFDK